MIVTVTPNPSVDRTVEVPAIVRGGVARSATRRVDAGGKGINVSRALLANGVATRAVVPVGGAEGDQLAALMAEAGVDAVLVAIEQAIRANVAVIEPDGTTTKFNEPGPVLSSAEVEQLLQVTADTAAGATWVVIAGRLPRGCDDDLYGRLVDLAHQAGAKAAVDTSGSSLLASLAARPDLIKPNETELGEAVGRTLESFDDVVEASQHLRAMGAGMVLTSLGEHGALLVDGDRVLHAAGPRVTARSTVGAGDSALAGFLTQQDPADALRAAVAFGAAAVQLPGTTVPGPDDVARDVVVVTDDIDLRTRLVPPALSDTGSRARVS